ncbi:MAG: biopolymer transporter ExbD [Candidatus Cloacimonadales bacterium]|nr:biopolymer transporter ExbD [Candidatus Cloacimonadales bacterium]
MKRLSYVPVRKSATGKGGRKRGNKTKDLNITSLIDILTILLVFMIKNISMDAAQKNAPEGMLLPTTITKNELVDSGQAIIVKLYADKISNSGEIMPGYILFGKDNIIVGSTRDFITDASIRKTLLAFLQVEAQSITENASVPCLLIQADKDLECRYITEFIKFSAQSAFANIYFSTIHTDDKREVLGEIVAVSGQNQ